MKLYFVSGSKQKKSLIESDYADDIIDVLIGFFEEHKYFPHILELRKNVDVKIVFESSSEYFLIEDINEGDVEELEELIKTYHRP